MDGPLRILIIEDRPAEADRLGALLTKAAGRACMWDGARDLTHARQALSGLKPDAILLDTTLPEANGVEALRALGAWTEQSAVLTLGTAESTPDGLPFLAAGAQDHLDPERLDAPTLWARIRFAVERHRKQRALRTQVDVLSGIVSTIPEAVLVVAPDGSVRLCNPGARALLDFAAGPEAALGPLRSDPSLLDRAATGETVDDLHITCGGRNPGEKRHYAATLRPVRAGDQDIGGLIVLRDETHQPDVETQVLALNDDLARSLDERTGALRLAEDANRLKTKFLEAVSHELRTPLTPILGFTRLLLRRPTHELAPEDQETLELIYDNANRLLRVVDSMLDFQALQRHAMALDLAPTAIPSLVADVAQAARSSLRGAPVDVTVDLDPAAPEILVVDGRRLNQILHRLMQNAVAHTQQGEIRFVVRWVAGRLTIGVHDTGCGIAPEHQARIFLAFYQVDPGMGPAHGVGLGLAYAQLLANAMGGTIQVQSRLGQGATFTVDVPAPRVESEPLA